MKLSGKTVVGAADNFSARGPFYTTWANEMGVGNQRNVENEVSERRGKKWREEPTRNQL